MSRFESFSIAAFLIIFGYLTFLFNAVLSVSSSALSHANGQPEDIQQAAEIDLEELFKNEYIFIAEKPDRSSYQEYLNNLKYYQEELYNTFRRSSEVASFIYYDIITGYTFSYNTDVEIPTSSSIKASLAIFVMEMVSQGKADLNKKLTYTQSFYNGGSGRIKHSAPGTRYTIEQLLEYMMIDSDNIAYLMLLHEFGYKNSQKFWFSHGTTTTYIRGSWGTMNARDALIYMRRLYSFYREDEVYGEKAMSLFKRARYRFLFRNVTDMEVAHKSGNTVTSTNDLAILFDKQPFIFIVLTRKNSFNSDFAQFFSRASEQIYTFHQYFWNNITYRYISHVSHGDVLFDLSISHGDVLFDLSIGQW